MFELAPDVVPHTRIIPARRPPKKAAAPALAITAYAEHDGMGMGTLSDGSGYLTQRGLAHLCGVQNAHIGTISRDWQSDKPRIVAIRTRLERLGHEREAAHRVLIWDGRRQYSYDPAVCEAILDYYALEAGDHIQAEAQTNRLRFKRVDLGGWIVDQFKPKPEPEAPMPLKFVPLATHAPETFEAVDAVILYICGLYALSVWMAATYFEGLKQRAMNASWNRLGLYLPLKAMLEIQAEAILRAQKSLSF
ncbi:hypothetical protein [Asticcacaulis benevestitus]|uniref:Uncharacterized protein n=1 Tax=Asticcacaulis benevestitus DSM 16100 = ATCC BAA-896 TaxID=1121022 RepID=V4PDS4_9CAUL|nr:hypothetical protein [Asticcacaulis benevestitus]ESQ85299.1 hypothetical protein ABENE_19145 [Asticcacaulis benevestitus DSM 16100 = ATCC BAA-896]